MKTTYPEVNSDLFGPQTENFWKGLIFVLTYEFHLFDRRAILV